jgi:hypothetical protein
LKNERPLEIDIDARNNIIEDFKKAIKFHLSEDEQQKLMYELLSEFNTPPDLVDEYSSLFTDLQKNGGSLHASEGEIWKLAIKDMEKEEGL